MYRFIYSSVGKIAGPGLLDPEFLENMRFF